jgi:serine/threonine protein kinase
MVVSADGFLGSACYTDENDEHNPMSYNYCEGTPGFRPLELCSMSDPDTKRYKPMGKLGSATNIWSLGASLISICNRESAPTTDFYSLENSIPTFNANAQQAYSQELRDLLDECVRYRGEHRIGPQDLLDSISRHTAGTEAGDGDTDRAGGMRWYTSADDRPSWRLPVKERYRLHMSHDAGEAERVAEEQEDADEDKEQMARQKKKVADAAKAEQAAKVEKAKAKKAAAAEKKKQKKGKK